MEADFLLLVEMNGMTGIPRSCIKQTELDAIGLEYFTYFLGQMRSIKCLEIQKAPAAEIPFLKYILWDVLVEKTYMHISFTTKC